MKDLEWLKEQIIGNGISAMNVEDDELVIELDMVINFLNQLDEPETLTTEWIDENKELMFFNDTADYYVYWGKLQNLLNESDETKDKEEFDFTHVYDYFEKCKNEGNPVIGRHWLEKIAKLYDRELVRIEPDTVATVMYDYIKAVARFKEILSMEVEEVEE